MGTILIADNDREFRELAIFVLRFAGYDSYGAPNGAECYKMAIQTKPDLILMDYDLPDMDGSEACKALKKDVKTASIPVIFLATPAEMLEIQARQADCDVETIIKPMDPDQLTESVIGLMKKVRIRRKAAKKSNP